MDLDDKFEIAKDVISTELDGDAVLMHVTKGKYLSLNETGSILWRKLESGKTSLAELVQTILDEYKVDESQCRSDVEKLLKSMVSSGVLEKSI